MISSTSWVLGVARKPLAHSSFAQGPFPEASFALPVPFTLNRQIGPLHHGQWDLSSFKSPLLHLLASPQRSLLLPLVIRAGRGLFPSSEASPHHSCGPFVSASPSPIPLLSLQVSSSWNPSFLPTVLSSEYRPPHPHRLNKGIMLLASLGLIHRFYKQLEITYCVGLLWKLKWHIHRTFFLRWFYIKISHSEGNMKFSLQQDSFPVLSCQKV